MLQRPLFTNLTVDLLGLTKRSHFKNLYFIAFFKNIKPPNSTIMHTKNQIQ